VPTISSREPHETASALLEGGGQSLALISAIVFVQRLAMPVAALGLGAEGYALTTGALFGAAALGFVRARAADHLAAAVRRNLLEMYLLPLEQGSAPSLPSSEVVTARLAVALPALVTWAVDGVAVVIAAAFAVPAVAALLAYTLGPGVLVPLGAAGAAGAAMTMAFAPRVERAWTRAWERSSALLGAVDAGYQGAIDLRAHGRAQPYTASLRRDLNEWSRLEGRARVLSVASSWGALGATLAAGLGASALLGYGLSQQANVYRAFLLILAAIPTLQTLTSGVSNLAHAHGELENAARQRAIAAAASVAECDETIDATGELRLDHVAYAYPTHVAPHDDTNATEDKALALRDVSLVLPPRESIAVMGNNGAGKTTLLYLLLGVVRPDRGRVLLDGHPVRLDNRRFHERIAFLSQRPFALPEASVAENLRAFDPDLPDERLIAALETVGVFTALRARAATDEGALSIAYGQLSSGQARRVMLARALLRDADLVALDEPDAHLDAARVADLAALLPRIARERRVLAVLHHRSLASLADRVIELAPPALPALPRAPTAAPQARDPAAHAAAMLRAHVLGRLSTILREAGLNALLVKGAALALTVYPSPAARPMSDIDLLVRRDLEERVLGALTRAGCAAHPPPRRPLTRHLLGETPLTMTSGATTSTIEVHTSLDKIVTRPIDQRALFARALPAPGLAALCVPAPEDHALLIALHAASHAFAHPIALLDLELLLRGGLDLAALAQRARAWRLETVMFIAMSALRELGAASVRDAHVAAFDPGPLRRATVRRFRARAAQLAEAPPLGLPWLIGQTLLRDDLGAWALGLTRFAALRGVERFLFTRGDTPR